MTTRWRLRPFDADRVAALSREAERPAAGRPAPAQPGGRRRPGRRDASSRPALTGLHDPETPPRRGRGRRPDRRGDPRPPEDRHLRRLRRRRRLRHEHPLGLPPARRGRGRRLLHPAPGRRGVRRQRRGPPEARRPSMKAELDRHGRLRDLGRRRGEAGPRAGPRADHHRPPHASAPTCPRPTSIVHPRLPGQPLPVRRPLRLRRWRSSWPGRSARASATARRRRPTSATSWSGRSAWWRWRRWPTSCRSHGENRILVRHGLAGIADSPTRRAAGPDGGRRLPGQEGADDRDRRLQPRPPDQRRRPARTGDAGRRDADDRRRRPAPTELAAGARPLQHAAARRSSRRSSTRPTR